ncbi:MAG TPA: hypothetical protein VIJ16_06620, partial [Gemmatimonadaceae bacterium]
MPGVAITFTAGADNWFNGARTVASQIVTTGSAGTASVSLYPAAQGPLIVTASATGYATVAFHVNHVFVVQATQCELPNSGHAVCWGNNADGEVGDGAMSDQEPPTSVAGGLTFASLASGSADHMCGLTSDGRAYCWGLNVFGQLGDGTTASRPSPTAVQGNLTFATIAVGPTETCGITLDARVFCWGWSGHAGFGDGVLGIAYPTPQAINTGGVQFTQISVGDDHACAIGTDGQIYCWGWGANGQLANDPNWTSHPTPLSIRDGR